VTPKEMRRIADGRIFTAAQAADLGMVDRVGYVDDAIDAAMASAGVREARVVMLHRPSEYRENVYSRAAPAPAVGAGGAGFVSLTLGLPQNTGPEFLYLWAPALQSQE